MQMIKVMTFNILKRLLYLFQYVISRLRAITYVLCLEVIMYIVGDIMARMKFLLQIKIAFSDR
jgi:hypothetical protein